MAISVPVPKDLSGIKTKVALNLTKRQIICFSGAAITGVPLYFLTKGVLGTQAAALIMVGVMLPFFFLAMYERDGFPAEKILYFMIRQKMLTPGMLIVQDAVWNRVSQNRERKIATRYYCDEFHLLLKEKQTAIYSVEIWKRFRKWGGIPTGLTQNVGDFLRSEEIEGILGNSDFVYLLNQNAKDQAILADKLGLSEKQLSHVTNSEPGSGLILFDNVVIPFVDKYPTDTKTYAIMNTKPEESVKQEDVD